MEKENNVTCPICKTSFYVKPFRLKRSKNICCSKACSNSLKKITYVGVNNHQYGLRGSLNSSFRGLETLNNNGYILEYCEGHPRPADRSIKGVRVRQHRLVVERNHRLFDEAFFENIDGWVVLKQYCDVHHVNGVKTDNRIENLKVLTRSEHTKLHNLEKELVRDSLGRIIGVIKSDELLGNPEVGNQQPS